MQLYYFKKNEKNKEPNGLRMGLLLTTAPGFLVSNQKDEH